MKIAVIMPCYNEEEVLEETFRRLIATMEENFDEYEILCINDGSRDKTWQIISEYGKKNPHIKGIELSRNWGHQCAVSAGIHHVSADAAIIIDADLQDPPEVIPDMVDLWKKEAVNVVYAVRAKRKGESFFKRFTARMFYRLINGLSEVKFPVDTGDFRLIDRKVIDAYCSMPERNKYIRGLISWMGFKQIPFSYVRDARFAGETKYTFRKMLKLATDGIFSFSVKPLRIAIKLGVLSLLVGLGLGGYILFKHFTNSPDLVPGWASTLITIIFFGGVQLLSLGILGEYLGNLFNESKGRPEYLIDSYVNLEKGNE